MHDPFVVRRGERLGKSVGDLDDLLDGKAARGNAVFQRLPLDQFHGQKMDAVGFLDRVERDDVRVVEGGDGAGFALEARQAFRIARHFGRQHLESDVTAEFGVGGAIHLAHAAGADRGGDPVMGERTAEQIEPPERPSGQRL